MTSTPGAGRIAVGSFVGTALSVGVAPSCRNCSTHATGTRRRRSRTTWTARAPAIAAGAGTTVVGQYVTGSAVVSLLCLLGLPETRHVSTELPVCEGA